MPPPMRFGAPNNLSHYQQQYPTHSAGLPPPSLASNPAGFMTANSMSNPFAVNGNALSLSGGFGGAGIGMPGGTGLGSHQVQMSFAGANLHHGPNGITDPGVRGGQAVKNRIRDVWASTLEEEMVILRCLAGKDYPYIAMDTEFPGIVARPMGSFNGKSDYHYQCMRCNVDLLKVIQLGITLFSEDGNLLPPEMSADDLGLPPNHPIRRKYAGQPIPIPSTWQFNFDFSLDKDMYSEISIDTLKQSHLDFNRSSTDGIDPFVFGSVMMSSGLICDEDVHWLSFHGAYDFGYLIKILSVIQLPDDETTFKAAMSKFFPSIYDIKYLTKWAAKQYNSSQASPIDAQAAEVISKFEQKASLEGLADSFKVKRVGVAHQAGSDSQLTGKVYFKIREKLFDGSIGPEHNGQVWGLSTPDYNGYATTYGITHSTPQHHYNNNQENVTPSQNGYANGGPSTPNTGSAGLASTPGHNSNGGGMIPITPAGGMGGSFGNFQYKGVSSSGQS